MSPNEDNSEKNAKMLPRTTGRTDPSHGGDPQKRTMEDLLRSGFINLDKPPGPTSHQVVAWLKRILDLDKAGHGGTLDPSVSGVLPVALGSGRKALKTLLLGTKEYIAVVRFHRDVPQKNARKVFSQFQGDIYQLPPVRSAVKRQLRIRRIHHLDILEMDRRDVLFRVECQSGTYIRTLCSDMGDVLGVGGNMQALRRTRSGPFEENESYTLHDVQDAYDLWKDTGEEGPIRKIILPVENLLTDLPKVTIQDSAVDAICHGADLAVVGIVELEERIKRDQLVALMTIKGEAVALGRARMSSEEMLNMKEGISMDTERVLMATGTYPSMWKKRKSS